MKKIRVLVVDDSALMRKMMKKILESDPHIEVVGTARDGEDGVEKARQIQPDVVTMDVNMPGMDGITALQIIVDEGICPVVMVSSLTQEGAAVTFEALELGAFDYVPKPGGTISPNLERVSHEIIEKVKAASKAGVLNRLKRRLQRTKKPSIEKKEIKREFLDGEVTKAVAIGISTGGPKTLLEVIPELPEDLDAAIFIVQHMPENFTASFANRLNQHSQISVKEANAGENVKNANGYLGKGGYHLLLRAKTNGDKVIRLSKKPETLFIPSVDVMMDSVLNIFGNKVVGVLMTGMGDDGVKGMLNIKRSGGITIAESEDTAIVFGMPKAAIEMGAADVVVPSYEIAKEIVKAIKSLD